MCRKKGQLMSRLGLFHHFTKGGQLALHQYRMVSQVVRMTCTLSFFVGICGFFYLFWRETTPSDRYLFQQYLHAEFKTAISFKDVANVTQTFGGKDGKVYTVYAIDILQNPIIQETAERIFALLRVLLLKALYISLFTSVVFVLFFCVRGHIKSRNVFQRGNRLMKSKQLTRLIRKKRKDSDLNLDGLPLIRHKETSHILITGTTGAGKSNCLHTLLPQIRKRQDRALIVDLNGEFQRRYFSAGDIILNPLDERSAKWLPWADCTEDAHFDQIACTLVPPGGNHDVFWENAGKVLLATALRQTKEEQNIKALYDLLVTEDLVTFSQFFRQTEAAAYTHLEGEKMTLSIRATLANQLQSFKRLKNTKNPFSIRKWVQNTEDKNWVFLSARPDQRDTLRPLMSAWVDIATNALMGKEALNIREERQRLWIVVDELPALQKVPSLMVGLAELRKYGGCILAGVQSIPQISTIYGITAASAILDLFNTKIFFRNTDPSTNAWIAKVLGEIEVTEKAESVSYGANTIRDGVSLTPHTKTKPLVLPSEISQLQDLEALIKLPGNFPLCKINMTWKNV